MLEKGALCSMTDLNLHSFKFNTLRPRQNGRHFPDDIFKCIFLNANVWISLKIWLKFVPKFRINNIPTLVQEWLGPGQATSHYLNQWWLVYRRIYASLGLNELNQLIWILYYTPSPHTRDYTWKGFWRIYPTQMKSDLFCGTRSRWVD